RNVVKISPLALAANLSRAASLSRVFVVQSGFGQAALPRLRGRVGVGVCGRPCPECFGNNLQHACTVHQDVVVPETENPPAFQPQSGISAVVVTRTSVLAS